MPVESVDLLIEARWVLPIAPVNTVLANHAVAVKSGRVVALGPIQIMNEQYDPARRVVRPRHALLPGFVNAHTRSALSLLRGLPVYGPRSQWLSQTVRPLEQRCVSADYVRDGTTLAIAEMLRSGITAFSDMYAFPEAAARVAAAAKMRAAIGLPVADGANAWGDGPTAFLASAERLWDEYKSDPWVSLFFAPHEVNDISDETLGRVRRVADELDARIAMRMHETQDEVQTGLSIYDRSPLRRLEDLGLLRPGFTAVHMNHLDADDLELVSRTGIAVVACTQSDLRLGSGVCAVSHLDTQHVPVGFGTSDPLSAGTLDILAEARIAALLANGQVYARDLADPTLSARAALRMATLGGAIATGLASAAGSIEPGKSADLVCWNLPDLAALSSTPSQSDAVAEALVFGATRDQATDVWTSGREAVTGGTLLAFDEQELHGIARQWFARNTLRPNDRRLDS